MILAEVHRSLVKSVDGFLVEFFFLPGTIHECGGQRDGVHDDESVDYEGHYCTRVSGVSGLALKV